MSPHSFARRALLGLSPGLLAALPAQAETQLRIGYQKSSTPISLLKSQGTLEQAWGKPALGAAERGEVALLIAEARVAAARAALEITSQVFEAMGARATASRYGFDRFWRNVRVHSLHDPLEHKVLDVGHWLLGGVPPTPSLYS